jgi:DICT domain-containing protein
MDSDDAFAIGELSRRTGVPQATLRTWENRYGLPRPRRLPGGHRRYDASAVREVERVLAHRAAGLTAEAAVDRVVAERGVASPSVFATLRELHPELAPQRMSKSVLMALTRAIEDEYVARADRPALFATFQQERFFRQSEQRWRSLARTAAFAAVFADFARSGIDGDLRIVALDPGAALSREWVLVCDSPVQAACIAGWEVPGQEAEPDLRREFETLWTLDPRIVRVAATTCAEQVRAVLPHAADGLDELLRDPTPEPTADLRRAEGLFHRVLGYVDAGW